MDEITQILKGYSHDDTVMRGEMFTILYDELKKIAVGELKREDTGHTLQSTALVHEAFLKLINLRSCQWENRYHFFVTAAEVMRRILIDHARTKKRIKRGSGKKVVSLADSGDNVESRGTAESDDLGEMLEKLDEALAELSELSPQKAELVKLRFFAKMTIEQAAEILGISRSTADRYWTFSKAWLYLRMDGSTNLESDCS